MIALALWIVALLVVIVTELRTDPPEVRLVPRCVRCGEMRDTGHRCRDADECSTRNVPEAVSQTPNKTGVK